MSFQKGKTTMLKRKMICLMILLVTAALALWSICGAAAPPAEKKAATFLDHIKPGQMVSLQEKDGRYELTILPPEFRPLIHTVIEVGQDYITLRDLANITDSVLPIYSIKSIKIIRVPGK